MKSTNLQSLDLGCASPLRGILNVPSCNKFYKLPIKLL